MRRRSFANASGRPALLRSHPMPDAPGDRAPISGQAGAPRSPSLAWLPEVADFRADLRTSLATTPIEDALARLVALAQHRLGFLETLHLDRAITRIGFDSAAGLMPVRLAVLASSTADHLVPAIRVAGLRRHLAINAHLGAYGQYRQELLDAASSLYRFAPQIILFALSARDFIAHVPLAANEQEADAALTRAIGDLRTLWTKAREALGAAVLQQTFLDTDEALFGSYDRLVPGAPVSLIARLNQRLTEAAAADGVLLLDIARASERDGLDAWFDVTRWLQAKMEISPHAAPLYGELAARVLAAQRGLSRKCLVLDLDNTLWGGVVGDDGIDGIIIGQGTAAGEAYLAFQRYAKRLKERGVILAACSKNDPATAEGVFRDHPEMILRRADFAAFVANWEDKAENLKTIARRLNIGLDSLVFVDDNPVERTRIRQSLPMVAVPELPADAAYFTRTLADAGYFEAISFTLDDRQRAQHYAANTERDALLEASPSMDEFLRGLDMSVAYGPFAALDCARVTQLVNKTNQFNPTTRRYAAEEIAALAADRENLTLQFRLRDRFGDNGLVSAMILRPDPEQRDRLVIENWVMSCRVFGRQLEHEAMNIAVEAARSRGFSTFGADYIPTPKNGVIRELYPSLGFAPATGTRAADGASRWQLRLSDYVPRQTHIRRSGERND